MGDVEEFDKLTKDIAIMVLERAALAAKNKEELTEEQKTVFKRAIGRIVLVTLGTKDDVLLELIKTVYSKASTKLPEVQNVTTPGVMAPKSLPMVTAAAAGGRRKQRGSGGVMSLVLIASSYVLRSLSGLAMMADPRYESVALVDSVCDIVVREAGEKCPWPILEGTGKPRGLDRINAKICMYSSDCEAKARRITTFDETVTNCTTARRSGQSRISKVAQRSTANTPEYSSQIEEKYEQCISKINNAMKDAPASGGRSRRARHRSSKPRRTYRNKKVRK